MDLRPAPFLSQNATAGVKAHEQTAECSDGGTASVITLHFGNDFHVAAVVDFIDGEPHIIELYAVDDNGKKI